RAAPDPGTDRASPRAGAREEAIDHAGRAGLACTAGRRGWPTGLSDLEVADAATWRPIRDVAAETLGIDEEHLVPYGHYKAKVDIGYLASLADRPPVRLGPVTVLSPTP